MNHVPDVDTVVAEICGEKVFFLGDATRTVGHFGSGQMEGMKFYPNGAFEWFEAAVAVHAQACF